MFLKSSIFKKPSSKPAAPNIELSTSPTRIDSQVDRLLAASGTIPDSENQIATQRSPGSTSHTTPPSANGPNALPQGNLQVTRIDLGPPNPKKNGPKPTSQA